MAVATRCQPLLREFLVCYSRFEGIGTDEVCAPKYHLLMRCEERAGYGGLDEA